MSSHLFWNCRFVRDLWLIFLNFNVRSTGVNSAEWSAVDIDQIWGDTDQLKMQKELIILWSIWTYRNNIFHNINEQPYFKKIVDLIEIKIKEANWDQAQNFGEEATTIAISASVANWTPRVCPH